jgi:3',5'-nucleoside bisphosphate phosphatase
MTEPNPDAPGFDLQGHSSYSDGELSPAETVRAAQQAGVRLFALTDHDSLDGVPEALDVASQVGIRVVTAAEISVMDPVASDLHVCAYRIDLEDAPLQAQLARSRDDRRRRAQRMIEALTENGWTVDREPLDAHLATGATLGRPHLAQAVVADPANAQRLRREQLADASAFLEAYLIEGKPAFRERDAPSIEEALSLIHGAGGVAVWAHPFWDVESDAEVIATLERFTQMGLDGVEAFYITHTREQTELLVRRASELELITTGSSDFHGPHHRRFNRFRNFETHGHEPNLGPLAC